MSQKVSEFIPVDGLDGIYAARASKLNCFALRLRDDSLCLYSPISGMLGALYAQLEGLGGVTALLAPNHYHNKGLQEHVEAFPDAALYCSTAAAPRLRKITGLSFVPLDVLTAQIADNHDVLEPEGLKTGEVWVEVRGVETAWIVTDAFSAGLLPLGKFATSPKLLGTFPRYGVKDASGFKQWTLNRLDFSAPTCLLPCHGSPVRSKNMNRQLARILNDIT